MLKFVHSKLSLAGTTSIHFKGKDAANKGQYSLLVA